MLILIIVSYMYVQSGDNKPCPASVKLLIIILNSLTNVVCVCHHKVHMINCISLSMNEIGSEGVRNLKDAFKKRSDIRHLIHTIE